MRRNHNMRNMVRYETYEHVVGMLFYMRHPGGIFSKCFTRKDDQGHFLILTHIVGNIENGTKQLHHLLSLLSLAFQFLLVPYF